jgi:hypothetical protein
MASTGRRMGGPDSKHDRDDMSAPLLHPQKHTPFLHTENTDTHGTKLVSWISTTCCGPYVIAPSKHGPILLRTISAPPTFSPASFRLNASPPYCFVHGSGS